MWWRVTSLSLVLCLCAWAQTEAEWPNWINKDGAWRHASGISLILPQDWKTESSDDQIYVNLNEPGPDLRKEPITRVVLRADALRSWQGPDRVVWLKYLAGEDAARWLPAFSSARWTWDAANGFLLCEGPPESLLEAEALLRKQDLPPRLSTRFCAFPVEHEQEARERAAGLESWLAGADEVKYLEAPFKLPKGVSGQFRRGTAQLGFTDHVNTIGYLTDGRLYLLVYSQVPKSKADRMGEILRSVRFQRK